MSYKLSRRKFLSSVGTAAAGLGLVPLAGSFDGTASWAAATVAGDKSLRDRAQSKGLIYGGATQREHLENDASFSAAFARECGILVPEGELKWNALRPSPDAFNFAPADAMLSYTQQHNMKFRGHTLMWHESIPKWFGSYVTPQNSKQLLLTHIEKVVGRYAGKIHSWDVVNEVIEPNDKRPDGLRDKPWLTLMGPDYIDTAFYTAAQADPKAILVWNENHLELNDAWGRAKRAALLSNLKERLKRGVPIRAVGIQSHIPATAPTFNNQEFTSFLKSLADLGVQIMITEMDVFDDGLPRDLQQRDKVVADVYYDYLSTVLKEPAVMGVLTWGLSDRYTWVSSYKPRSDGASVRPLPLDAALNDKPAKLAIERAFDEASQRLVLHIEIMERVKTTGQRSS